MSKFRAIVMKPIDNVATVTEDIAAGTDLTVHVGDSVSTIQVTEPICFGHKVAIQNIAKGEPIIKYGNVIGMATRDILAGQHTHIHNLDGCRGRGDLAN